MCVNLIIFKTSCCFMPPRTTPKCIRIHHPNIHMACSVDKKVTPKDAEAFRLEMEEFITDKILRGVSTRLLAELDPSLKTKVKKRLEVAKQNLLNAVEFFGSANNLSSKVEKLKQLEENPDNVSEYFCTGRPRPLIVKYNSLVEERENKRRKLELSVERSEKLKEEIIRKKLFILSRKEKIKEAENIIDNYNNGKVT